MMHTPMDLFRFLLPSTKVLSSNGARPLHNRFSCIRRRLRSTLESPLRASLSCFLHHLVSSTSKLARFREYGCPIDGWKLRSCMSSFKHDPRQRASNMQPLYHMCSWVHSPVPLSEPPPSLLKTVGNPLLGCPNGRVSKKSLGDFSGGVITRVTREVSAVLNLSVPKILLLTLQNPSDRMSHTNNGLIRPTSRLTCAQ